MEFTLGIGYRPLNFGGDTIDEVNEFLKFINDSFTYTREYKENLALEFNNALDNPNKEGHSKIHGIGDANLTPFKSLGNAPNSGPNSGHANIEHMLVKNDQLVTTSDHPVNGSVPSGSAPSEVPSEGIVNRPNSLVMWDSNTEYVTSPFLDKLAKSEKVRQVLAYNYNFYILSPIY